MKIYIVPGFHHDVAYLKSWQEYLPDSMAIIDKALDILGSEPGYRFIIEQVILLQEYWKCYPHRRNEIIEFVRQGHLEILPGAYVTADTNIPCGESLFMQITLGKRWLREHLEYEPRVWWIVDNFGHHSQMPQILRSCGYEYYVFTRGMSPQFMRNAFVWQGIDGTEIKTFWLSQGYGNIIFPQSEGVENVIDLNLASCSPQHISKLVRDIQRYGEHKSVMLCNCGDMMYPQPIACEVVEHLNAAPDGEYTIEIATPEKFLKDINWTEQPRYDGEFNSLFQGIFGSNVSIKLNSHKLINRLLSLEKLAALSMNKCEYPEIWELLLKQQFHDIIAGTICNEAIIDAGDELAKADRLINECFDKVSGSCGEAYFFNPCALERKEIIEHNGDYLSIYVQGHDVAALKDCKVIELPATPKLPIIFENEFYTAHINEEGYISELVENESGSVIYGQSDLPFAHLNLQVDNGDLWLNFEGPLAGGSAQSFQTCNLPDPYNRRLSDSLVQNGTFAAKVEHSYIKSYSEHHLIVEQYGVLQFWRVGIKFRTTISLSKYSPRIDYRTMLETSGRHYRVRVAFPTTVLDGGWQCEIPFGIQDRGIGQYPAQSWVDLKDDAKGLAVFNRGIPGHSIDGSTILMTLLRSTAMEYKAPSDMGYLEGMQHTFDYAVMPHGANAQTKVIGNANIYINPLIAIRAKADILKWTVRIYPQNVCISSIRSSGGDIFFRVYEAAGKQTKATMILENIKGKLFETNGSEDKISGGIDVCQSHQFNIRPFEIRGFKLNYE